MRKGKNRYIVEVNDWGCGLMIKDTQTGREIDAPDDEVITLCIKEMNSLAKELDTVRSVAQENQAELKATRIENARLKAEAVTKDYLITELKAEVERLTEIIDSFKTMPIIEGQSFNGWKLDEHHRLVSLVEHLRAGSIEGAKQFTHKEYRDFQKTMIEKNAAKEGKPRA